MNLRIYFICIAAVLALTGSALANSTSTVHGSVYGWDTFEPLENAIVEVNSTPSQSMVAKYGLYSFDLVPGDYKITANYYQNNTLTYSTEETLKIENEGNYVLDLLLLPVYSKELMGSPEVNKFSKNVNEAAGNSSSNKLNSLTDVAASQMNVSGKNNSSSKNSADQSKIGSINTNYPLIALLLLFLLTAAGYRFSRMNKNIEKNQPQKMAYRASDTGTAGKGHTIGDFSEPVKVPKFSGEVHNKRAEAHPKNIEPELKLDSEVQESKGKPLENASAVESVDSVKEPVKEPVKESLQEPVQELVKEPVSEQMKTPVMNLSPEIPNEKLQEEAAEIKVSSLENETKMTESETQKEKQGISYEENDNNPVKNPKTEVPASRKKFPLPTDLQEVMDIIRGQGGRITQKDLRSKLKYSEGKVSLMLADLERRELIEKFKRGRGNVVILKDEER
ncbi:DUF7343 domain-containing protein [Methanosarcina sp. UBA289]|uniref:DUF7343 domain-containing protein n=1 Tax=Methanosarcina sp. UBA289 TaxID=1915574 RepID=UPI0025E72CC3|nr:hypothetical protein [Methanosarcina sp. UBA289]